MTGLGRLRGLRHRLARAVAEVQERDELRAELAEQAAELAAVRAAYARDAALFVAHRAAWDRERARLVAGLPPAAATLARIQGEVDRFRGKLINLDERRAR